MPATHTAIPCRRPKVTITPHQKTFDHTDTTATYHLAQCHVPGCSWTYDAAVVTDAQQHATWHRAAHRDAVPDTWIERDPEYDVHCTPCGGHRRTFSTRVDAEAWLNHHLVAEHGLVTC